MERTASEPRLLRGLFDRLRPGRVEVTGGFLLLAAWLNYLDAQGIVPLALVFCALHELGHLTALGLLGRRVRRMSVTVAGAELEVDRAMSYGGEALAALAGPAVNLGLALVLCRLPGGALAAGLNLVLACFNLLPVGRLDGGRVLRCALSWLLGPERAWGVCRSLDWMLAGALAALGAVLAGLGSGPTLLLTALWLWSSLLREDRPGPRPASAAAVGLLRRISQKIH